MVPLTVLLLACALTLVPRPAPGQQLNPTNVEGEVIAIEPGVMYLGGFPHKLALVRTPTGEIGVAVPSNPMTVVQVGERIAAAGRTVTFRGKPVIDPRDGYVYRQSDKEMGQFMADQQAAIQKTQAEMASSQQAVSGEPNAVPITVLESSQQRAEREAQQATDATNRRLNLVIGILTLLVAIIAVDRRPPAFRTAERVIGAALKRASVRLRLKRR